MASSFSFGRGGEPPAGTATRGPLLVVEGLDVYYGRAHALQDVSFTLPRGVLGIVGRHVQTGRAQGNLVKLAEMAGLQKP